MSSKEDIYRKALERLASMEAFDIARNINPTTDTELLARINYARTVLDAKENAGGQ